MGARRRQRLRALLLLGVGGALTLVAIGAWAADALRTLDLQTVDARFELRGAREAPRDLVVVAVDDVTFRELDQQWPFPRSQHGVLIDRLEREGARVIAYDVQFSEQSEDPEEDNFLIDSIAAAGERPPGRVVLAATEFDETGEPNVLGGGGILEEIGARAGFASFEADPGGIERRVHRRLEGVPTFPIVVAEEVLGRPIAADELGADSAWIDFVGPPGTIRTVSFSRAMQGRLPDGFFRDAIVVVGAEAPSLQDVHTTSSLRNDVMSGPELQANAIVTALDGFPLRSPPWWLDGLLVAALGMVAPVALLRTRPWVAALVVAGALLAFLLAAQLAFEGGVVLTVAYPLLGLALGIGGALAMQAVTTAFERERVREVFTRFVPEGVVDDVLASADGARLGGVEHDGSVLFVDLRGFTAYSEARPAVEVMEVLNRFLGEMTDAVLDAGGTLTTYLGDGIMALFGGPLAQDDHADRAIAAARNMLLRLESFNEWARAAGHGEGFRVGIGVNSGSVISGNVGSERRLDYTAIGDTVNTASRLEGLTKGTPHTVYVAATTVRALKRADPDLVEVGLVEVRGRRAPVHVWTLESATAPAPGTQAAARADA